MAQEYEYANNVVLGAIGFINDPDDGENNDKLSTLTREINDVKCMSCMMLVSYIMIFIFPLCGIVFLCNQQYS